MVAGYEKHRLKPELRGSTWDVAGGHVLQRKYRVLDRKKRGSGVGLIVKKGFWRVLQRKSAR